MNKETIKNTIKNVLLILIFIIIYENLSLLVHEFGHYFFGTTIFGFEGKIVIKEFNHIFNIGGGEHLGYYSYYPRGDDIMNIMKEAVISISGFAFEFIFSILTLILILKIKFKEKYELSKITFLIYVTIVVFFSFYYNFGDLEGVKNDGYLLREEISKIENKIKELEEKKEFSRNNEN